MDAGRVRCVHGMRQYRCNDVVLVVRMRQKEKFWWYAFGVVVFLGEEQDHARPPLMGDETAQGTGSEWRSRQAGARPPGFLRRPASRQLPTSIIIPKAAKAR